MLPPRIQSRPLHDVLNSSNNGAHSARNATTPPTLLDALALSLAQLPKTARSHNNQSQQRQRSRGGTAANASSFHQHNITAPSPSSIIPAASSHYTRRQSSATMRRKLEAIDSTTMHTTRKHSHQQHQSLLNEEDTESAALSTHLPPTAHIYTRQPITNFIASLSHPQNDTTHNNQWETRSFPSLAPLLDNDVEIRRLQSWFDDSWRTLEEKAQRSEVRRRKQEMTMQRVVKPNQAITSSTEGEGSTTSLIKHEEDEKTMTSENTSNTLSAATLHSLCIEREKLCFLLFQEIVRHVGILSNAVNHQQQHHHNNNVTTASGSSSSSVSTSLLKSSPLSLLLSKLWRSQTTLYEQRLSYRLNEIMNMNETYARDAVSQMAQKYDELIHQEKSEMIQKDVDMTYIRSELDAKSRIITNLQEENDRDLLYSNQIVCTKEMAYLKLERASKATEEQNVKLTEDMKYLTEDKQSLEETNQKLEEEKEELMQSLALIQESYERLVLVQEEQALRQKMMRKVEKGTQYDLPTGAAMNGSSNTTTKSLSINTSSSSDATNPLHRNRACISIQRTYRGFHERKRLKRMGMLSEKQLKKIGLLAAVSVSEEAGSHHTTTAKMKELSSPRKSHGKNTKGGGKHTSNNAHHNLGNHLSGPNHTNQQQQHPSQPLPSIPSGFSHLLSPSDMTSNRQHFIRLFTRKNLLKWIMKLYMDKTAQDWSVKQQQEEWRKGREKGSGGNASNTVSLLQQSSPPLHHNRRYRKDLSDFIYDYYLLRHGQRDACEMDLIDLFASCEKHSDVSSRVRVFMMFLRNEWKHRKIGGEISNGIKESTGGGIVPLAKLKRYHANEQSHAHLLEGTPQQQQMSPSPSTLLQPSPSDIAQHEMKLRLLLTLHGGRHLSSRLLDFYLLFLSLVRKYGSGPFQNVCDNNDGLMWIDLTSLCDLTEKAFSHFPQYLLNATLAKMKVRANGMSTVTRASVMQMDGLHLSRAAESATQVMMEKQQQQQQGQNGSTTNGTTQAASSTATSSSSDTTRFVDYDTLCEVLLESYLDEDARQHHMLYDLFLNPNPQLGAHQQKERKEKEKERRRVAQQVQVQQQQQHLRGQQNHHHQNQQQTHHNTRPSLVPSDSSGDMSTHSLDSSTTSNTAPQYDDSLPSTAADTSVLEPEMFSFLHFCDVVRAVVGSAASTTIGAVNTSNTSSSSLLSHHQHHHWDESLLLRVYQLSVQRAQHRSVTIEDFVITLRCFGLMPVDIDVEAIEQQARLEETMKNSAEALLPPLLDPKQLLISSTTDDPTDALTDRRSLEFREKLREVESSFLQKLEYQSRRHEKEVVQLKQVHEHDLKEMQSQCVQQVDQMRRQLEMDRAKAAHDYNLLFDSTTLEIATIKHNLEQKEKHSHDTLTSTAQAYKSQLLDYDHTVQLLQNKLNVKQEKYKKKKELVAGLQQRMMELETMGLSKNNANPAASPSSSTTSATQISPETRSLLDQYKRADSENRAINESLRDELEMMKMKYKEMKRQAKEMQQMMAVRKEVKEKEKENAEESPQQDDPVRDQSRSSVVQSQAAVEIEDGHDSS